MAIDIKKAYLDHAEKEAIKKGFFDFPIVDADCHYFETPFREIGKMLDEPWRTRLTSVPTGAQPNILPRDLGDRVLEGRTKSKELFQYYDMPKNESLNREFYPLLEAMYKMAIDYTIVFPTDLLTLGLHPQSELEVQIAKGYARWMTEEVCPHSETLKVVLYLPLSDPQACLDIVNEFADKEGVVGFMVTSTRYNPIHHNCYMPLFKLLEEKNMPLAFHTVSFWMERPFQQLNKFMSAHALGFPFYNMIQMTNLVVNGIPERFPNLKFVFIEAGLTWIPFVMSRLDHDYLQRSSEAPLLKKKPSEYIRDFYFTTQPLDHYDDPKHLAAIFDMIDGENKLLFATDYPHQDFNTPGQIYDLPFLSEEGKRKILGENALKLWNLEPKLLAKDGIKKFK
jgi:uncharacterized protein